MDPPLPPIEVTVDEPAPPGDSGAAPEQLFFIHGWPDSAALWDEQVAFFVPRGYRCLRVTMPHYHGRETADAAGDLLLPSHVDWGAATQRLAEALREHGGGKPVTLVIHDWGSVWGFYLQLLAPDLVKGIVAMDVGPWALSGRWRNVPAMLAIGLVYQYWLATAHIIGRASSSAFGQGLADWMTRAFARLAKRSARPPPAPHPTPPHPAPHSRSRRPRREGRHHGGRHVRRGLPVLLHPPQLRAGAPRPAGEHHDHARTRLL